MGEFLERTVSGVVTTNHETDAKPKAEERDPSTLSESERDQRAYEMLIAGKDPRSINYELSKPRGAGNAKDADGSDSTLQDESEHADDRAGGDTPDADGIGGGGKKTAAEPASDPGELVLARRRLMRDYSKDEISELEQSLGAEKLVKLSQKVHTRNAEFDRLQNEKNNPQAKGKKTKAEEHDDDEDETEDLDSDLSERIAALREEGFDDVAETLERAVQTLEEREGQIRFRSEQEWLQKSVSKAEREHPMLATEKGAALLTEAMTKLSKSGLYSRTEDGIADWVSDAVSLCTNQRSRQPKLTPDDIDDDADDLLDGQPDHVHEAGSGPKVQDTRQARDAYAMKLLQAGMPAEEVHRRVTLKFSGR